MYLIFMLVLTACDTERLTGFNYQANGISQTAKISGRVVNIFTSEPVEDVIVSFRGQSTVTNDAGEYSLDYLLAADEEFNKPVDAIFSNENFFELDTTFIVFPTQNNFDVKLVYGAPIITDSERLGLSSDELHIILRATIFDYQGVNDIDSVVAQTWYYWDNGVNDKTVIEPIQMTQITVIDANSALYEAFLPLQTADGYGNIIPSEQNIIEAFDKSDFYGWGFFKY